MDKELEELLKLAGIGHKPVQYADKNDDGEESPLTYGSENVEEAAEANSDLVDFVRQLHIDGEIDLDDENAANDIDAMLAYEEPAEGEVMPTVEEIRAAIDMVRGAVEEDMLKPKGEPDLYDDEMEEIEEAEEDDDENPEVDFVEGDLVMIGYGHNEGKAAEVVEFSPSGLFATVRLKDGEEENHNVGDLFALGDDFDEEEYYGLDLDECGVYEDEYVDENAFNTARDEAIASGKKSFSFNGKTYPVTNVGDDDVERAKDRFEEDLELEDDYEADMCELVIDNESAFYFLADNFTAEMSFGEGGNICLPERLRGKAEMLLTDAGFSEGDDFRFVDAVEEADLQNGYDDHHYVDGEDYFPTGNDGPAPKKLGPSAARHGNNPLGTSMKVDESNNLHESLKKRYRKFRTL